MIKIIGFVLFSVTWGQVEYFGGIDDMAEFRVGADV
jgi:hypothetical protein